MPPNPSSRLRSRTAYTLVEVLVAMGILSFGILGVLALRSKTLHMADNAASFSLATNLTTQKYEQCKAMDNYLDMFCAQASQTSFAGATQCAAGESPLTDGCCRRDPGDFYGGSGKADAADAAAYCAGREMHVESLPDSYRNDQLDVNESTHFLFRRRTEVAAVNSPVLKGAVQVDTRVCWDRPTMLGKCDDTANPDNPRLWDPSYMDPGLGAICSYCVTLSFIRMPD